MKADAATVGIENRVRQKMVEIDNVRSSHDKTRAFPIVSPDQRGEEKRDQPMPAIMQQGL